MWWIASFSLIAPVAIDSSVIVATIGALGAIVAAFVAKDRLKIKGPRKEGQEKDKGGNARRTKSLEDYIGEYREAMLKNPNITSLQLPDMHRMLKLEKIYVGLKLYRDLEMDEVMAEASLNSDDLEMLFKASQQRSGIKARTAFEPERAVDLCEDRRCVIVGDPGAGKTTLLKHIAILSASRKLSLLPNLPVYVQLSAFANSGKNDMLDFASSDWEKNYNIPKEKALKIMRDNLITGKLLLLLDGLDETVTGVSSTEAEESYERVVAVITDIATRYHKSPIIVTARKAGYRQRTPLRGFTEMDILELQAEDIKKFVDSWFNYNFTEYGKENAKEDAINLNTILENNPRLHTLAVNPLLLSLIVIVYETRKSLPNERAKLYGECVRVLLEKWDATRNIHRLRQFTVEHKVHLLEEVAWYFHLQGKRYFPNDELLSVIEGFLPAVDLEKEKKEQILSEIANENGLLKEQAADRYGFLHLTLQEYFVAQQISDADKLEVLLKHRDEPWWEEVILLYAGYTRDASLLLENLLEQDNKIPTQQDLFYTNLLLAGRCIATGATIRQTKLRRDIIARLFEVLENASYIEIRYRILEVLTEINNSEVKLRLLEMISANKIDRDTCLRIIIALGKAGAKSVKDDLLSLLQNANIDKYIRKSIANALSLLGDSSLVEDLLPMLEMENSRVNNEVRESIADALGILGSRKKLDETPAIFKMLQLLVNEQINTQVRMHIADALGWFNDGTLAPKLLTILSNAKINSNVRMHIAHTLGRLKARSVVSELLHLLENREVEPIIGIGIADALADIGDQSVVLKLLELLSSSTIDPNIQGHIAAALGHLGNDPENRVSMSLLERLSKASTDTFTRQSCALALGMLGVRSVVPALLELLLREKDEGVSISIVNTLGALGERSIAISLIAILSQTTVNADLRKAIADAIGKLGEGSVIPNLQDLLEDPKIELNVRGHIARTLGLLVKRPTTLVIAPLLVNLLFEEKLDPYVGLTLADSVGALGDRSQVSRLIALLSMQKIDNNVRKHAANALAHLTSDEETVRELAELLQTSDIADDIYRNLWIMSRRTGTRVFLIEKQGVQYVEIVKWQTEEASQPMSKSN